MKRDPSTNNVAAERPCYSLGALQDVQLQDSGDHGAAHAAGAMDDDASGQMRGSDSVWLVLAYGISAVFALIGAGSFIAWCWNALTL